jgi:hypothetical protein
MGKFIPRYIPPESAALGYNNEGKGELIGYISDPFQHEEKCPYRIKRNKNCACRIGLWQERKRPVKVKSRVKVKVAVKKRSKKKKAR